MMLMTSRCTRTKECGTVLHGIVGSNKALWKAASHLAADTGAVGACDGLAAGESYLLERVGLSADHGYVFRNCFPPCGGILYLLFCARFLLPLLPLLPLLHRLDYPDAMQRFPCCIGTRNAPQATKCETQQMRTRMR